MASVDLPSGRVGVVQLPHVGRGPAQDVVMIHGLGANFGFWYASAAHWFCRFGRVTLFDLPGHGISDMPVSGYTPAQMAKVLGELLDHLGIAQAHLVAHSFGGVVALAFAAKHPERVKDIVLADVRIWGIEPPTTETESVPWLERLRSAGIALADPCRDPSVQLLVELARLRVENDDFELVSEIMPAARGLFSGRRSAKKWLKLIETTQAYEEMTNPDGLAIADVAKLEHAILAVYGGHSNRKRSALALQRTAPRCHVHIVPEVGHFFPLTRPRLFARPSLAFLRWNARNEAIAQRRAAIAVPPLQADLADIAEVVDMVETPVATDLGLTDRGATDAADLVARGIAPGRLAL